MIAQVTAAALVSENRQRATPASVDSIPTCANQEDHVSMAAIIGIELLVAAQGCDFHAPLTSSPALERLRALLRAEVPHLEEDRHLAPDIAKAIALVRSGRLTHAPARRPCPGSSRSPRLRLRSPVCNLPLNGPRTPAPGGRFIAPPD